MKNIDSASWPYCTYIYDEARKLIYAPIAKNGCSSLKFFFYRLLGGTVESPRDIDVHQYFISEGVKHTLGSVSQSVANQMLSANSYVKFVVIRNPLERAVSAYVQKFITSVRHDAPPSTFVKDVIDWIYFKRNQQPDYSKSINFAEFVDYLINTPDRALESHWAPQYLYLGDIDFDKVFTMDQMVSVFEFLRHKSGADFPDASLNVTRKEPNNVYIGDLTCLYPYELREIHSDIKQNLTNYGSSTLSASIQNGELSYKMPSYQNFLPDHISQLLREKYARDCVLYEKNLIVR